MHSNIKLSKNIKKLIVAIYSIVFRHQMKEEYLMFFNMNILIF